MTVLIGLSGWAQSGKDTVANYLVEDFGFTRVAFADPMREALLRLNPWVHPIGAERIRIADLVKSPGDWEWAKKNTEDVRELLQRFGTEVGREMFGDNFWVDYALNDLPTDRIIVTDVRFVNEANAIRLRGGMVFRVEREGNGPANDHPSENELNDYEHFAGTIYNDRSKEDLRSVAHALATVLGVR